MMSNVNELMKQLETGVSQYMTGAQYTTYLKAVSKFHDYSFNNVILILLQRPEATRVAGYKSWQSNFHRNVRKGEKGIRIFAPAPIKAKRKTEQGEEEYIVPRYKVTYVWDVSQTEGEDLPSLRVDNLSGDVDRYDALLTAVRNISVFPIEITDTGSTANGFCSFSENRIVIQTGMSEAQTVKTAIHELAHSRLHSPEQLKTAQFDQSTCEIQAESVAYIVCDHFGLDTSDYSFPYVASWSSGQNLKELRQSHRIICSTAHDIILKIENTQNNNLNLL